MGAMALGLFASLLIGTIFDTLGNYIPWDFLKTIATYAKSATGMAIGVAIAYKLGAHPLVIFSCAGVGALGNAMGAVIYDNALIQWAATAADGEQAYITVDGEQNIPLSAADTVTVRPAAATARLIRMTDTDFYECLRHKLSDRR